LKIDEIATDSQSRAVAGEDLEKLIEEQIVSEILDDVNQEAPQLAAAEDTALSLQAAST